MASFLQTKAAKLLIYLLTYVGAVVQAQSRLLPGSCSFESNTCGYESDADHASWVLHRDGHFVAVEALNDDMEGSSGSGIEPKKEVTGILLSPPLEHQEWSCMRLVYQIAESGHLEVLQRSEGRSFDKPLWSSQVPSDSWIIASVDLQNSSEPFRIVINGRAGPSAGSSVAIFEIHISPGYCLECDFEEPLLCGYNNQWNVNVNWYVGGGGVQLVHNNMPKDHTYHNKTACRLSLACTLSSLFTRHINNRAMVFEVGFNSPRGGHVAVDDISFSPEFCNRDTEPTFDPSIANCDFESGLCLYTQDRAFGSSWRRVSVKPNIFRNGDHTTGAGSFLLAHSQLGPRSGYVSRVISPTLPGNTKFCLRFYFLLKGFNQTEQALAVYLLQQGGKQEKIWTQAEKSRGIWILADVTFQTSQPAKMAFVTTCRSFWDCGSVALDDISLNLGDCELTAGFPSSGLLGHCDFEAGLCGYTQDKVSDSADWHQRRGSTPTSYTGPRGDHTMGLGYYMYIEASPMLPGQNARLVSQPVRGNRGPQCLQFFYHMYGTGTGKLRVLAVKDGEEELLWQRSGEQSIAWLRAQVEYQSQSRHQIVFEATRGGSVRSDIAIDDIMLDSGPCPEMEVRARVGSSNEIE
ncbi:PREDICTED: MAM domain-containing protein 2 [Cyprinodon variegatus]|uniref:MAM domain-containing protein 2 n=1 Tax=Cyprinodon variegatus TaxID=28743 RepID=UPI000742AC4A|nr:PREDICTED: MAM domain-containing protein 2 [Cyprinodon variegatus]